MHEKNTPIQRESAYTEGKRAFDARKGRGYNPYTSTNQELAMSWWHGWDTAQEEVESREPSGPSNGETKKS